LEGLRWVHPKTRLALNYNLKMYPKMGL